jgi:hypothetical protein
LKRLDRDRRVGRLDRQRLIDGQLLEQRIGIFERDLLRVGGRASGCRVGGRLLAGGLPFSRRRSRRWIGRRLVRRGQSPRWRVGNGDGSLRAVIERRRRGGHGRKSTRRRDQRARQAKRRARDERKEQTRCQSVQQLASPFISRDGTRQSSTVCQ